MEQARSQVGGDGRDPDRVGGAPSEQHDTIGGLFQALQEEGEDPERIFIARGIRSLGFQSHDLLLQHYSRFGRVGRVLVARSRVKKYHGSGRRRADTLRLRPGNFAFIVMASAESLARVFWEGAEQTVAGKRVSVEPFKSSTSEQPGGSSASAASQTRPRVDLGPGLVPSLQTDEAHFP